MNKTSTTILMGGLGNMLFELATLYAYSKKYGYQHYINFNHNGTLHTHPNQYKDNIFRNFPPLQKNEDWSLLEEKQFHYEPLLNYGVENLVMKGFFQSEKHFSEYRNDILNLFSPTEDILNYIKNKYGFILNNNFVSLHVRRGNYQNLSEYHHNLKIEYYKNAIDYFNGFKFLVFSDDINWCKENFIGDDFIFVENESDIVDLYLMSLCQHNVIANSTFSWWGAWLNQNPNKIVIHPNKWFGPKNEHKIIKDLFPNNWVCLTESTPKMEINLMGKIASHLNKPNGRFSIIHGRIAENVKIFRNLQSHNISIFADDTIESDLHKQVSSKYKIGWLYETREVYPSRYDNFEKYKDNYDFIITHDSELLQQYPDKTKYSIFGGSWIKTHNYQLHPKIKNISMIYSQKNYLTGHKIRHQIANSIQGIDLYGRGTPNVIENKEDALLDYRYSIVIENSKCINYFTEKLLDCFATGTIPVYWGCPNISNYFNMEGIITFNDVDELKTILPTLTPELYESKLSAIKENLEKCKEFSIIEDWMYKNILKDL